MENIRSHEKQLTAYAMQMLQSHPRIKIYGSRNLEQRGGAISFKNAGLQPPDLAHLLDYAAICIRGGHHCTQPLMRKFGIAATARISFYLYNTEEDIDRLAAALNRAEKIFL